MISGISSTGSQNSENFVPLNTYIHPLAECYDLSEVDWAVVMDYMDMGHIGPLHWLCSSSHGSTWCLGPRIMKFPWVLMLHHLDKDILSRVIEAIDGGCLLHN